MSNLLIALIVIYIITVIIQIGYCVTWYHNAPSCHCHCNKLSAILIIIINVIFAPIMVLFEIGAALMFTRLN